MKTVKIGNLEKFPLYSIAGNSSFKISNFHGCVVFVCVSSYKS